MSTRLMPESKHIIDKVDKLSQKSYRGWPLIGRVTFLDGKQYYFSFNPLGKVSLRVWVQATRVEPGWDCRYSAHNREGYWKKLPTSRKKARAVEEWLVKTYGQLKEIRRDDEGEAPSTPTP